MKENIDDNNIAIISKNISKTFHITEDTQNSVKQRLFNILKQSTAKEVKAIKLMNFEIKKGECFGIIGRNGSGKSTLVKILAGVYPVDTGYVKINGSTMLMNLGVGMSHELTARENIYVSGSVLGLKIKQIDLLFDKIIEFAELEEFVDTKIKYFSSGMLARLAFSIAVNAGADIMFLDEIFAVGDFKFQEKAVKIFEKSWIEGKTVVLISHSMATIEKYCQRVAYLKHGELVHIGTPQETISMYLNDTNP
ncbi:MAG: ABC transporter ATP-binding protein [Bacteroidetes bacterium]|nr:ABC transporter ATP-binding protein [Bacteroidota bacterium]